MRRFEEGTQAGWWRGGTLEERTEAARRHREGRRFEHPTRDEIDGAFAYLELVSDNLGKAHLRTLRAALDDAHR